MIRRGETPGAVEIVDGRPRRAGTGPARPADATTRTPPSGRFSRRPPGARSGALLSLATGAGKTYIAVHLLRRLADAGLLRRALFLVDHDELRNQALGALQNAFGADAAAVSGGNAQMNARVLVATYQTLGLDRTNAAAGAEADAEADAGALAAPTTGTWYFDLSDVKVTKKQPLTIDRFEDLFALAGSRAGSPRSWTVTREELEARGYDLKAVNPTAKAPGDTRTPLELLDEIESRGREVDAAVVRLRGLLAEEASRTP